MAEDSAATADLGVCGAFSPDELEEAAQLAAAQAVDSDAGTWRAVRRRQTEAKLADAVGGELVAADR